MMSQQIQCPNCGEVFTIEANSYAEILKQVRDNDFYHQLDISKKLLESQYETKIAECKNKAEINLINSLNEKDKEISRLKNKYETELQLKDEQIEKYKEFKLKQSTKMVGESLEKYCETVFNKLRSTAFQNSYFEKDNQVSESGSKGDYIFREYDEDGTEYLSIMFEMKNENEETYKKHKNEEFFKELDKDRNEKQCEYAVLVSMLEMDNELYNEGIVDVSYKYSKMFVIRPQFFISIISLLRNASRETLRYKKALSVVNKKHLDIADFEKKLNVFKTDFGFNCEQVEDKLLNSVKEIDKAMKNLQKSKDAILSSINQLKSAENKVENLQVGQLSEKYSNLRQK